MVKSDLRDFNTAEETAVMTKVTLHHLPELKKNVRVIK